MNSLSKRLPSLWAGCLLTATLAGAALADNGPAVRVAGARPAVQSQSVETGAVSGGAVVSFGVSLPWRNQDYLSALVKRLYDPTDPLYHQFLTSAEFSAAFAPAQSDYDAVVAWANGNGLRVTGSSQDRELIRLEGSADAVQNALHAKLAMYKAPDGHIFRSPASDPLVPADVARRIVGFTGLSTAAHWHPNYTPLIPGLSPANIGSGPGGGVTPANVKTAYGLSGASETGSGQTVAVLELATYTTSDITAYDSYFGLPAAHLQNFVVSIGASTAATDMTECTLDIELITAMAPGASSVAVYETANDDTDILAAYSRIANDNTAKQVSTSWGIDEADAGSSYVSSENQVFTRYAAQGQTLFASAGDNGAYDNGTTLSVDDPGSQPFAVSVGGTSLSTSGAGGAWLSETTWNSGSIKAGAGGGGISTMWTRPSYQSGIDQSGTMRCVPDVSFDADPNTGYSIYFGGKWYIYGGTSCAAPLWAAFDALVNQRRSTNGMSTLGFANPVLYALYGTSNYATAFHDIADNSTNLYYHATTGYDLATGLGSPQAGNLLTLLGGSPVVVTVPAAPGNLAAIAGNASVKLTWNSSTGATLYTIYRKLSSAATFTKLATTTALQYTDTTVTNGTSYTYTVTASNSAGESGDSNTVTATPAIPPGTTFPAGLNFFSLPYSYSGTTLDTLFGYTGVKLAVFNPQTAAYVLTPTAPANAITPGQGYWVRLPNATTIAAGTPASVTQNFTIPLGAGWNQIGDPFTTSVSVAGLEVMSGVTTYTFVQASQTSGLIGATLYGYNQSANAYTSVTSSGSLQPGQGYWVYAYSPITLIVPHP